MTVLFDSAEIIELARAAAAAYGEPRCAFIMGCLFLDGAAYADPDRRDQYVEELYFYMVNGIDDGDHDYHPTDQQRSGAYSMASVQSTCGVLTRRVWRYARVAMPALYDFYGQGNRIGTAVSAEMKFAQDNGAWISGIPWVEGSPLPEPGDAMIIGCSSCGGEWSRNSFNGEHEYTIVATAKDGDDDEIDSIHYSIDGGQPGINLRTRKMLQVWTGENASGARTGELWVGALDKDGYCAVDNSGRPLTGRRTIGFSSAGLLPVYDDAPACEESGLLTRALGQTGGAIAKGLVIATAGVAAALGLAWGVQQMKARPGRGLSLRG